MRFLGALLNSKSDRLDPDIIGGIPQCSIRLSLGAEPTEGGVTVALGSVTNAKAVGPDELSVELFKLGLRHEPTLLQTFLRVMEMVWCEGKMPHH